MFLDERMGLSYVYAASRGYLCILWRNMGMGYNELVGSAIEALAMFGCIVRLFEYIYYAAPVAAAASGCASSSSS